MGEGSGGGEKGYIDIVALRRMPREKHLSRAIPPTLLTTRYNLRERTVQEGGRPGGGVQAIGGYRGRA